jgi:hypothetical protein
MSSVADLLGVGTTLVMFFLIVAGVMKLFQLGSDVRDMKEALQDIRRNTQHAVPLPSAPPAGFGGSTPGVPTPEELVRAVHAQSFGDDFPL